jgi:MraZ protein
MADSTEKTVQVISRETEWRPFFTWEYTYSVDGQGRVQFPPRWRPPSGSLEMVAVWLPHKRSGKEHIRLLTLDAYSRLSQQNAESADEDRQLALQRTYARRATAVELDKAGRLTLPPKLLERAGIGAEALFVGCGSHVEMWSEKAFRTACKKEEELVPEDLRIPDDSGAARDETKTT